MYRSYVKGLAVAGVSALALAAAGQAAAVDFQAGDTTVSIYGYAIGKMSYDINESMGDATAGSFGNLRDDDGVGLSDTNDSEGYTDLDASQSRIGFQTTTDMGGSDLVTRIEGDFRSNFRLRHAYGTWNGILAGQTWSNYNTFVGATSTLDFNSLAGLGGYQARVAQFRYTVGDFSVAVEDPQSSIAGTPGVKDSLPALTARYEGSSGAIGYSFGGIIRQVEDAGENDDITGYGAFAAASYDMGAVTLNGVFNYVDGATSYLYQSGFQSFNAPDAYVDGGELESVSGWGGSIGAGIDAGPGTVNIGYGRTELDSDDVEAMNDLGVAQSETNQNLFLNYMWQPVERVTYGIEYGYWKAEGTDGEDIDASRVSVAAQYVF
ncbi:DcaP family trimeric outer membrane transporter [Arhodomonas aquaeolei]|uniref:DcaP family trimeric outer membrane transporter n=1 Tax=Arhodomonas aquaeolei TaxID=2369 RepID=UPI00216825DD|nr:DcaP family trimeric outer membrane transporter [Arhodomonas aquaeolei]MCS4503526.1 DcaP family trimeric outer membrane transporter [Arhodomonas aquaeolei]